MKKFFKKMWVMDSPFDGRGKKQISLYLPLGACAKNRERHKKQKTGIQK
jgi:hypothetical protein